MIPYGSLVKIIAGFYLGCTGIVLDYYGNTRSYKVDLRCKSAYPSIDFFSRVVSEEHLREVIGCKK